MFTDEYIGLIYILFITNMLLKNWPLQRRVLKGEGGGVGVGYKPGHTPDRLNGEISNTFSLAPLCPSEEIFSASGNLLASRFEVRQHFQDRSFLVQSKGVNICA